MKQKHFFIIFALVLSVNSTILAYNGLKPVAFYLQNLPGERIGTDPDNQIIADLEADGFLVVPVDCSTYPTTSPELEEALMQFHLASPALLAAYENATLKIDFDRIFYVPAGYRIEKDIPIWNIKEHGAEGSLNRIMGVYNNYVVPTFGVTPVTSPDDMVGPKGEPLEYNLYMDIMYPSGTPVNKVPTLVNFSSNLPRQKPFSPKSNLEVAYRCIFPIGFATTGYAIAHVDHCYNPLARDVHYDHFNDYSLDSQNGLYASRAFIRYLRKYANKYNLNTKFGVMGISKSSYSAMRIMHTKNAEQEEHLFFNSTPNNKPQPWEGYDSWVDVGYTAAGNGVTRAPLYVDSLTCPMITSAGKFDSYDQWVKYPSPVAHLNSANVNHLTFWMEELGHTFPGLGTDYATEENRYFKFKQFFDHYLKPEKINQLDVYYAYPRKSTEQVDTYGLSRTLPADNLLPQDMAGVSPYAPISVRFLSEIDTVNLYQQLKVIDLQSGNAVAGKWKSRMKNRCFEFIPKDLLILGKDYQLRVETTIRDIDNHALDNSFERNFTVNKSSFKSGDVFFDDFNRANIAQGGIPTVNYTLNSNVTPTGTIESSSGILRIYNSNASANVGMAGSSFMSGNLADYDQIFSPVLKENQTSEVVWTFNMRSMKQVLYSFNTDSANYALAVVLVASENNFLSPTCKGYAVTLRNMVTTNAVIRLERFENGLGSDASFTSISAASETIKTNYASVKVTYEPKTDTWKLYYRIDGTSAFKNPLIENDTQGYLQQAGNDIVDATYTATPMISFGFFLNHGFWSSGAQSKALFDNFKVFMAAESSDATNDVNNLHQQLKYKIKNTIKGFAIEVDYATVEVINLLGMVVKSEPVNGSREFSMNTPGTYLVKINKDNNRVITKVTLY